nr:MAG TPA: hypothetical protein [Bacteriophage sp.]
MSQNSIETILHLRSIGFKLPQEDLDRIEEWEKAQIPLEQIEEEKEVKKFNSKINKVISKKETIKNIVE